MAIDVGHYIDQAVQTVRDGYGNVNYTKGLIIALGATIFMQSWKQLLPIVLVAVIIDRIIAIVGPALTGGNAPIRLPPELMQESYWIEAGVLFVGYAIVISIFFFLKKMLFRGGGKH